MSEWKEKILDELGYTYPGLSGKTKKDFGNGKPFVPFMNVMANGKIDPEFLGYVEVLENEHQNEIKTGDLFFTTSSETPEEVGMTSVLLNDIGECYLNSFCFGFRLYNYDDLIPDYAPYLFRGNEVRKQIINLGQGYTRFNLPKTELVKKLTLNLPTIPEQQKISEILTAIDNIIDKTQAAIAKYKVIKQGMLHDLFTRGIDIQTGKLRPHYKDAPELYKESKLGWIPKEWEVERLGNRVAIEYGKSQKSVVSLNGTIPVYGTGGLIEYATEFLFDGESILVGRKGTIDKPIYIKGKFWTVDTAYYLTSFSGNVRWLHSQLEFYNLKRLNEATGVPSINRETFYNILLSFPQKKEQDKIEKKIIAIDTNLQTEQSYLEKMQQIKKGLME
ncbi:MAG TPA: restriction endonuclease subunit S, partial [Bacteroidales bacterium]|nr:restriction endonuclease subunit S [Bacteroidales bacterium]